MPAEHGYVLPDDLTPDRLCFRVSVPNDKASIAAFMGQLSALGYWYNWQRDESHFARLVSEVWFDEYTKVAARYNSGSFFVGDCAVSICDEIANCPPNIRTSASGLQWHNPNTGNWEDIPNSQGDPRTDGTVPDPWQSVPAGQQGNCLAAENITAYFKKHNDDLITTGYVTGALLEIIPVLMVLLELIFLPAGLILAALFEIAAVYADLNATDLAAAFTTGAYDAVRCAINCRTTSAGRITASAITGMKADVAAYGNAIVSQVFNAYVDLYGPNGLMKQEVFPGIVTGDCSGCDCGWCYEFDFATSDYGFSPLSGIYGHYSGGLGWVSDVNSVFIYRDWPATLHITSAELEYTWDGQCPGAAATMQFYHSNNFTGSHVSDGIAYPGATAPDPTVWDSAGTSFGGNGDAGGCAPGPTIIVLRKYRIRGTGTPPTIGVPCA